MWDVYKSTQRKEMVGSQIFFLELFLYTWVDKTLRLDLEESSGWKLERQKHMSIPTWRSVAVMYCWDSFACCILTTSIIQSSQPCCSSFLKVLPKDYYDPTQMKVNATH